MKRRLADQLISRFYNPRTQRWQGVVRTTWQGTPEPPAGEVADGDIWINRTAGTTMIRESGGWYDLTAPSTVAMTPTPPPVAQSASEQKIETASGPATVTLDGSESAVEGDGTLTYEWFEVIRTWVDGPPPKPEVDPDTGETVTPPRGKVRKVTKRTVSTEAAASIDLSVGRHEFELVVTSPDGQTGSRRVDIDVVRPRPEPVAAAKLGAA